MIRAGLRGVKEWTNTIESRTQTSWEAKKEAAMTMRITYPDGTTEIISEATRVDQQNFH
jgi:hypothetical protein